MSDTVLVTGASRGIGRAVAETLAHRYTVVVHYHSNEMAAQAVAAGISRAGGTCRLLRFDVADRAGARQALEADVAAHGAYYGVVLNAGISRDQAFPMLDGDDWDRVLRTNLDGFYNVLNPVVMPMIRRRAAGRIVVMTSLAGVTGNRGQTNYAASTGGLIWAAKSLALELAKRHITVNCVAPGFIETDMTAELPADELRAAVPMRRLGTPADVAGVVAFLCSPDAAYVTRQVIGVDGGLGP
jgi:3-oxoacyl-[acyl-carrier protein] reductase